jgi:cysteine-S-conjugate beta-lyase
MHTNFNQIINRRESDSLKWNCAGEDILPMWVADTDFLSPQAVIEQLKTRVEHGIFGYPNQSERLIEGILSHLQQHFQWKVTAEDILLMAGVVPAINLACRVIASPGEGIMIHSPVYGPFFQLAPNGGFEHQEIVLRQQNNHYYVDMNEFESAIKSNTRIFVLCNPHNPVGRVYTRPELEQMAELCLRHKIFICSDEIHSDLVFSNHPHIPIASLSKEIADHTITCMAPSKTFNIAGLDCSFVVITNPELRANFKKVQQGLFGHINLLGQVAAEAAYHDGQAWLKELLVYLEENRNFMADFMQNELPEIPITRPEGTYLAWLDFRNTVFAENPAKFLLERAKVQVNDGLYFGQSGKGFVRLNFGCPRATLKEGLQRIKGSIK